MPKIDISLANGVSGHALLDLLPTVEALAERYAGPLVLPAPDGETLLRLDAAGGARALHAAREPDLRIELPRQQGDLRLTLGYGYRDASNYKAHGRRSWSGRIDRAGLAEILSALLGDPEGFIPEDLGFSHLAKDREWELDWEENDHPWHQVSSLSTAAAEPGDPDIATLLERARDVLENGFDEVSAMQ